MSKPNDIPAFPRPITVTECGVYDQGSEGMTLRDYFAGQALIGMSTGGYSAFKDMAHDAYAVADAMLEQRSKQCQ